MKIYSGDAPFGFKNLMFGHFDACFSTSWIMYVLSAYYQTNACKHWMEMLAELLHL